MAEWEKDMVGCLNRSLLIQLLQSPIRVAGLEFAQKPDDLPMQCELTPRRGIPTVNEFPG